MKRYLGLAACLMMTIAIGVKFRPAAVYAQQGGNVYDPSGGSPLVGDSTIAFTKAGGGYSVHVPGSGGPPTGAAGGDLSGTYPNPTVAKVNGNAPTTAAVSHQFVTSLDSSARGTLAQPTAADIAAGTFSGANTFSSPPTMSGANITSATIPGSALASTAVTPASYTNTNLTVDQQGRITAASNGSGGANPGFINTPTVSAGAATLVAQCTAAGCTDYERLANGSNSGALTLTTPASGSMTNGQELFVEVDDSGTAPSSIAYTAGAGVTLNYSVLGNAANATACGAPPTTGNVLYRWAWNSTAGNLTLLGCGPQAGAATLSSNLGGTGADLHTAGSGTYPKANGSGVYAASTLPAAGTGSCTNQAVTANNGDAAPTCTTLTSAYVNNTIALTGTDINTSNQVTATHIAGGTNTDLAVFNSTGNVVPYGGAAACTNQAVTAISAAGATTCTTLTSAFVNNTIALTGTDINTSNQVTATHIAGGTNTDLAVFNSTGNVVNYAGSGPLASHNFATQISAAGALTGAQPAFTDISGTATVAQTPKFVVAMSVSNAMTNFGGL